MPSSSPALRALRAISSCSAGLDHVDLSAATARRIPVGHTPGVLTDTTAELAIALLFAAARRVVEADRNVREGHWREWSPDLLLGRDLSGSTLGIIGLGAIGRAVAVRARALGMRVLGWNRTPRPIPDVECVPLPELLARSDFVSVHVALAEGTRGLLDAAALAGMRPGAVLVNVSRGGIVDEAALAAALASGRLAAAALDVFETEPLPQASPSSRRRISCSRRTSASASVRTRTRMADLAVDNLLAGLRGERCFTARTPRFIATVEQTGLLVPRVRVGLRSALPTARRTHAGRRCGRRGGGRGRRAGGRR